MYDLMDRPIDRLVDGSRFLLWAMRQWSRLSENVYSPPAALAPGFARLGALEVLDEFHLLMLRIQSDRLHNIVIATAAEPVVGESEALLLALWRDIATDRIDRVRAVLDMIFDDDAIEPILASMTCVAAHLATMGLAPTGPCRAADLDGSPAAPQP